MAPLTLADALDVGPPCAVHVDARHGGVAPDSGEDLACLGMKKPPAVKQGVLGALVLVQCVWAAVTWVLGVGYWHTSTYSCAIWTRVWVRAVRYTSVPCRRSGRKLVSGDSPVRETTRSW